ncbi:M1 family metallopeptidase [Candidatus Saccharibacteria bacterium]|nr:M1 family metallopeptidase [Candidatus Saccharibacteria bacterium]
MERLIEYYKPAHYALKLNINKHTGKVFATAEIEGELGERGAAEDCLKLHAKNLSIREIELNGTKATWRQEGDILEIEAGNGAAEGSLRRRAARIGSAPATAGGATGALSAPFLLHISYSFALNTNMQGAYLSSYQNGDKEELLVSTQFESHYARECFPCVDEPEAKATFDLTIITPDTDDTVISNMPAKKVRTVEYETVGDATLTLNTKAKKKIVEFETTPKMSTYLLAFCLGKFHKRSKTSKHGVKVTTYCAINQDPKTLTHANDIAADTLDYYDDKFGIKYPLPKLDQVAIPDFEAGAMENWGLVTYRESCLLAGPDECKAAREYIATVIAHELSHQWFGDLVTMKWWDNLWLNESFADLMEYVCVDAIRPRYHIWENFYTGECRMALLRDALPGVQAVQQDVNDPAEIATLFDGAIVYAKGAHLMFMLMRLLGKKAFYSGLKDYFKKYAYQNTTGDDLWAAFQSYADFDVKNFMDAWISQPGFPVITDGHQQRFLLTGATDDTKWPLPEVKDDMSGHYIINLSSEEFAAKLKDFSGLTEEQKLRLLLDRSLLAKTSLVSSATHLDLVPKFKNEKSYAIWSAALGLISDLKLFFTPEDTDYAKFQRYIYNIVEPTLTRLGLEYSQNEDDNETKLRSLATGLALYAENTEVIKRLAKFYKGDLAKIEPELRSDVLLAKLKQDESIFDDFLKKYRQTADPNIKDDLLSALSLSKSHTARLIKLLDQHDIVKPQDHLYLFVDLLRNSRTRGKATDWLYDHWTEVEQMTGEKSIEDYVRLLASSVRTIDEAKRFTDFFTPMADNPVLTRAISVAQADIDARLHLLSMDSDDVHRHLAEIK